MMSDIVVLRPFSREAQGISNGQWQNERLLVTEPLINPPQGAGEGRHHLYLHICSEEPACKRGWHLVGQDHRSFSLHKPLQPQSHYLMLLCKTAVICP